MDDTAKIVIIGDGAVGKTSLLWRWALKEFKPEIEPTVFENYHTQVEIAKPDGRRVQQKLTIWDTGGQEMYEKIRTLSYSKTHVFLVCFSVDSPSSYHNVKAVWVPEISKHLQHASIILVGTKADLRPSESSPDFVSTEAGNALASEIRAFKYVECSAKADTNVKAVFDEAVRAYLTPPPPEHTKPRKEGGNNKICTVL
eukprot:Sspe_Gene.52328::Locus_29002_Transcript_1_1_Confidence_1.000_Length_706::g.52328::m.52328/K07863/RHOG; Ras homolog gene family, member G